MKDFSEETLSKTLDLVVANAGIPRESHRAPTCHRRWCGFVLCCS